MASLKPIKTLTSPKFSSFVNFQVNFSSVYFSLILVQKMLQKRVSDEDRWKIVGAHRAGCTQTMIAKRYGVSQSCVSKILKKFRATGSVVDRVRKGRRRILSQRDLNYLRRKVRMNPRISTKRLAAEFNSQFGTNISHMTVSRRLREMGLNSYAAFQKQHLKRGDRSIRLKWAKEHKSWYERWSYVVFSDEANYEVKNRKSRVSVRRFAHEKNDPRFVVQRFQGGGGSVGIWGCITEHGTGVCHVYDGRLDQNRYIDILENCLLPSIDLYYSENAVVHFQQDNAPCHKAKKVMRFLHDLDVQVMPWPARSPDLNPIENLWSWIDRQLLNYSIETTEQLKDVLPQIWLQVPVEMCRKLVRSMTERCNACIKAKGGYSGY